MSALTTEWKLKTGENSVRYTVVVPNFRKKINTFKGRSIWSKDFNVGRSVFYLSINPSGTETNSTDVGVYLANQSDWDVIVKVKFEVNGYKMWEFVKRLEGKTEDDVDTWGSDKLVPHHRCTNGDLLFEGEFELKAYVEVQDEEILPHHDGEDEEIFSKMKSHVDEKFESVDKKFESMERKFSTMEAKLEVIDRKISSLSLGGASSSSSRDLECPVCAETVMRPMRLYQCGQVGSFLKMMKLYFLFTASSSFRPEK